MAVLFQATTILRLRRMRIVGILLVTAFAAPALLGQSPQVGKLPHDRRVVQLKVASVNNGADRRKDRQGNHEKDGEFEGAKKFDEGVAELFETEGLRSLRVFGH